MQHFLQLCQVVRVKTFFGALHDEMQIRIADVIVIHILLGRAQAVFPLVGGGPDALHIAFFDQRVDFIRRVGGGKVHHMAELRDRRLAQRHNDLHTKGFHRRQGSFAVLKTAEDLLIEMQLEFCVYLSERLIQHGENPPVG